MDYYEYTKELERLGPLNRQLHELVEGKRQVLEQCVTKPLLSKEEQSTLKDAGIDYSNGRYKSALAHYKKYIKLISNKKNSSKDKPCHIEVISRYMIGKCLMKSDQFEDLMEARRVFLQLEESIGKMYPMIYHALARIHIKLYCFREAEDFIAKGFSTLREEAVLLDCFVPEQEDLISESMKQKLELSLSKSLTLCSQLNIPDGICFMDNCKKVSLTGKYIFFNSPAFNGVIQITCNNTNPCSLLFHISCWRAKKSELSPTSKITDKEVLNQNCFTPNCGNDKVPSVIKEIKVFAEDKSLKSSIKDTTEKIHNQKTHPTASTSKGAIKKQKIKKITVPKSRKVKNLTVGKSGNVQGEKQQLNLQMKRENSTTRIFEELEESDLQEEQIFLSRAYLEDSRNLEESQPEYPFTCPDMQELKTFIFSMIYHNLTETGPIKTGELMEKWKQASEMIDNGTFSSDFPTNILEIKNFLLQSGNMVEYEGYICPTSNILEAIAMSESSALGNKVKGKKNSIPEENLEFEDTLEIIEDENNFKDRVDDEILSQEDIETMGDYIENKSDNQNLDQENIETIRDFIENESNGISNEENVETKNEYKENITEDETLCQGNIEIMENYVENNSDETLDRDNIGTTNDFIENESNAISGQENIATENDYMENNSEDGTLDRDNIESTRDLMENECNGISGQENVETTNDCMENNSDENLGQEKIEITRNFIENESNGISSQENVETTNYCMKNNSEDETLDRENIESTRDLIENESNGISNQENVETTNDCMENNSADEIVIQENIETMEDYIKNEFDNNNEKKEEEDSELSDIEKTEYESCSEINIAQSEDEQDLQNEEVSNELVDNEVEEEIMYEPSVEQTDPSNESESRQQENEIEDEEKLDGMVSGDVKKSRLEINHSEFYESKLDELREQLEDTKVELGVTKYKLSQSKKELLEKSLDIQYQVNKTYITCKLETYEKEFAIVEEVQKILLNNLFTILPIDWRDWTELIDKLKDILVSLEDERKKLLLLISSENCEEIKEVVLNIVNIPSLPLRDVPKMIHTAFEMLKSHYKQGAEDLLQNSIKSMPGWNSPNFMKFYPTDYAHFSSDENLHKQKFWSDYYKMQIQQKTQAVSTSVHPNLNILGQPLIHMPQPLVNEIKPAAQFPGFVNPTESHVIDSMINENIIPKDVRIQPELSAQSELSAAFKGKLLQSLPGSSGGISSVERVDESKPLGMEPGIMDCGLIREQNSKHPEPFLFQAPISKIPSASAFASPGNKLASDHFATASALPTTDASIKIPLEKLSFIPPNVMTDISTSKYAHQSVSEHIPTESREFSPNIVKNPKARNKVCRENKNFPSKKKTSAISATDSSMKFPLMKSSIIPSNVMPEKSKSKNAQISTPGNIWTESLDSSPNVGTKQTFLTNNYPASSKKSAARRELLSQFEPIASISSKIPVSQLNELPSNSIINDQSILPGCSKNFPMSNNHRFDNIHPNENRSTSTDRKIPKPSAQSTSNSTQMKNLIDFSENSSTLRTPSTSTYFPNDPSNSDYFSQTEVENSFDQPVPCTSSNYDSKNKKKCMKPSLPPMDKLMKALRRNHPNALEYDLCWSLQAVRRNKGNSLEGIPLNIILNEAEQILINRRKRQLHDYESHERVQTERRLNSLSSSSSLKKKAQTIMNPWKTPKEAEWKKETECVICMEDLSISVNGTRCELVPCLHNFHKQCIKNWFKFESQSSAGGTKNTCPSCRKPSSMDSEFPALT